MWRFFVFNLIYLLSLSYSFAQIGGTSIPPVDIAAVADQEKISLDKIWKKYINDIQIEETKCKSFFAISNAMSAHDYILKKHIDDIVSKKLNSPFLVNNAEDCVKCTEIKYLKCLYKGEILLTAQLISSQPKWKKFLIEDKKLNKELVENYINLLKEDMSKFENE